MELCAEWKLNLKSLHAVIYNICYCLVAKSGLILCNPMNCSPPGSSVHEISQVRILEWVTISFSTGSSQTQGLNLCLLYWQADSLPLSHQGSPQFIILHNNMFFIWHSWNDKIIEIEISSYQGLAVRRKGCSCD